MQAGTEQALAGSTATPTAALQFKCSKSQAGRGGGGLAQSQLMLGPVAPEHRGSQLSAGTPLQTGAALRDMEQTLPAASLGPPWTEGPPPPGYCCLHGDDAGGDWLLSQLPPCCL